MSKRVFNLPIARLIRLAFAISLSSTMVSAFQFGQVQTGGGFTIFGRVSLPNGKPAARVKVYLEGGRGVTRDTISDDQGQYEIRSLPGGRYRVRAVNPDAPEQVCDPTESDTTRAYSNRLQIDVFLKFPLPEEKRNFNAGAVSVDEAAIPKPARKAYEQGLKLQKEKQTQLALAQLNQAIELYPSYVQALTERGNVLTQQNRLVEAEADFAQALKLNGKYAPAWRGIGYCQIQQKNFAAAVRNLENAFALEPNVPMTLFLLGYGNLSLNRYEEAKQCLQQALRIDEKIAARAHVYLGEIFAHEQKFKEAADEIRAYLKVKPDATDAAYLKELEATWRNKAPLKQP
ncbi:MAG: tetratricopeptide repeat protein [Blastocatellia bacterium]|nr:tetratricopeptide repeat protein [Blastocatellia bacterium]